MGVAGLRVGRITDLPSGASPDVQARLDEAFEAMADAGADIVDVEVPAFGYGLTAYYLIAPAEASSNLARFDGVRFGTRVAAQTQIRCTWPRELRVLAQRSSGGSCSGPMRFRPATTTRTTARAQKIRRLIAGDFAAAYAKVDVLLTPASPTVAFEIGDKSSDPTGHVPVRHVHHSVEPVR